MSDKLKARHGTVGCVGKVIEVPVPNSKSKCCGKPVRRESDGVGQWASNWYVCTGCNKPTDVKEN